MYIDLKTFVSSNIRTWVISQFQLKSLETCLKYLDNLLICIQVGMGKQHFTKHAYVETGPLPTCCWREVQTPTPRMSLMRPPCITLVRGVWLRLCTLWCNAEEIWRLWTKMENLQLIMQPRLGVCKNCFSLKHQGKNIKINFFCLTESK